MNHTARIARTAVLATCLPATCAAAADGNSDLKNTKSVLTGLIQETLKEKGVPSVSIALVQADVIVWKEAFGYSNVRTKTPATPDTLYNVASTFKAVVEMMALPFAARRTVPACGTAIHRDRCPSTRSLCGSV